MTIFRILSALALFGSIASAQWTGRGYTFWPPTRNVWATSLSAHSTVNATTDGTHFDKFAYCGQVEVPGYGTKSIRNVGFLFGTVSKTNGSNVMVSLQNIAAGTGPPGRPDESVDEWIFIDNADAGFTSNAWYTTGNLSADRSVTNGEMMCVVFEFGSTNTAGDSFQLRGSNQSSVTGSWGGRHTTVDFDGTSWTNTADIANVLFRFSDGTYGTFTGATASSDAGQTAYQSASASDEYANEITLTRPIKVAGVWGLFSLTSAAVGRVKLLNSSDAEVIACDVTTSMLPGTSQYTPQTCWGTEQTLAAGTYKVALESTAAANVNLAYMEVANADYRAALLPGGEMITSTSRANGGSWGASSSTRVYYLGLLVTDVPSSGSGGTRVY